ncbi:hypothetical protein BC835DRAFT_1424662 [Cytidiella melzeri]|nr:hypothetical protein BC835DRAFT_1424662 [Cytidiella melzeri]
MAQPLFDEHPLEEYFRETGDIQEVMPGSHPEYSAEPSTVGTQQRHIVGSFVSHIMKKAEVLSNVVFASSPVHPSPAFAERFKYDVISSSLLSTSLAASPQPGRRSFVSDLPGRQNSSIAADHSRTSTGYESSDLRVVVAIISAAVLAFAAGYELLPMLLIALALYVVRAAKPQTADSTAPALTLDSLSELISAGNVWDSVVNEAMAIVENDERSPSAFYSPTSQQSPLLSLRVALQTSLTTTQSQCDNVRQLLAALTSPQQLSQLSEMYAPATPVKPSFPSLVLGGSPRPFSDSVTTWRNRTTSLPSASNKRATWNGSQVLTRGGLEGLRVMRRHEKRRSDLNSLFLSPEGNRSAPPTPLARKILHDVKEEEGMSETESESFYAAKDDVFGVSALNLRRKRRSTAIATFGTPPPSYSSQTIGPSSHPSLSSISSPSRFTLLHTNRRPFSLSALSLALHGALSAKRYSCAHLLALRFEEDADDDSYWEDVRSIMALLTSTFSDASNSLVTALDDVEKQRMKDGRPSTDSLAGSSRDGSMSPDTSKKSSLSARPMRTMAEMTSFAPLPSHLTRFAAHVDAISSALNDAREHLEQCVAAVRDAKAENADVSTLPNADGSTLDHFASEDEKETQNAALQAYDHLRKELGFAFRECERGRERLLDVIAASQPALPLGETEEAYAAPSLVPDTSSEASFGLDTTLAVPEKKEVSKPAVFDLEHPQQLSDDATEHLLLTATSQHLPRPGIEQVYEADSSVAKYTRERSKLSREERIQLANARRESGVGLGLGVVTEGRPLREQWGPGGEVVQELKDVIWQVSEKRRRFSERMSLGSVDSAESSELPSAREPSIAVEDIVS